jgi:hypothetical protein
LWGSNSETLEQAHVDTPMALQTQVHSFKLEPSAMTRIALPPALLFAFVCALSPAQAQVQASRTFVSVSGSDGNSCTSVDAPCRHLAAAYAATSAGGEIDVLDPANYGEVTITQAISIEGHGWTAVTPVSGSAAITINAGPTDKINIRGMVLDGLGVTGNGIQFNSGGSLNVQDSIIGNLAYGIFFQPTTSSQLFVSNTKIFDNSRFAIDINVNGSRTVNCMLDRVEMKNNFYGLYIIATGITVNATLSESASTNNVIGVITDEEGGPINVLVRNSTIANNTQIGLLSQLSGSQMWVTRSAITGNATAWSNVTPIAGTTGGVLTSFGDNDIVGNANANNAPPSIPRE